MDQAQLCEDLVADVDGAFPALVDAYGSMVVTLATRLTDAKTGEDITQEVFLRAYRALQRYSDDAILTLELRPWLATITRNLVRNEYRRRSRRPTVELDATPAAEGRRQGHVNADLDAIDGFGRLEALLSTLTDDQREAIVLRHVVDLPIREVALVMGCPVGTAKSHCSRGLANLRAQQDESEER